MRIFATKQPIRESVKPKKSGARLSHYSSPLSTGMPLLQRQCACGGGCPRCQEDLGIQTKLKIGQPNDKYEQEADRIADAVMRMPEPSVQRQVEFEEEEEEMVQRKAIASSISSVNQGQSEVPPIVHEVLRSPGQPLDSNTRSFMESRFGQNVDEVRVYHNSQAAESAQALNAVAYTVGRHIVFNRGKYVPQTSTGKKLVAHELTHVLQQRNDISPHQLQRTVNTTSFNCPANTHGAPADPLAALTAIDRRAQLMALGSSHVLFLDSVLINDPSIGVNPGFTAYQNRFDSPQVVNGGFRNRFTGTVRASETQAASEEMVTLSNRFERLHSFLAGPIRYRCRSVGQHFIIGGCQGRCSAGDFAHSCVPQDRHRIVICPDFWTTLSLDQQAGVLIHEAVHMLFNFAPHLSTTLGQRGRNPECYTSFVADLYGFTPVDPRCPI